MLAGKRRCAIAATTLSKPAKPATNSMCSMLLLTDPTPQRANADAGTHKTRMHALDFDRIAQRSAGTVRLESARRRDCAPGCAAINELSNARIRSAPESGNERPRRRLGSECRDGRSYGDGSTHAIPRGPAAGRDHEMVLFRTLKAITALPRAPEHPPQGAVFNTMPIWTADTKC